MFPAVCIPALLSPIRKPYEIIHFDGHIECERIFIATKIVYSFREEVYQGHVSDEKGFVNIL